MLLPLNVLINTTTMSLGINIDYKNNKFKYMELTCIIREPTTATLIVLLKEVCTNVSSVQTDLGGDKDSHLGLVCTPAVYQTLVPDRTAYARPTNPGRLQLLQTMTQYAITQACNEHAEATILFRRSWASSE